MINPLGSPATAPAKAAGVARTSPVKAASRAADGAPAVVATPAAAMAAAGPPVDAAKVARIKAGIADGSYQADAQSIARSMIAQDLEPGA